MINQTSILIVIILVMGLYFYALWQTEMLQRRYHNDERWQQIRLRANHLVKRYYESLIIIVALIMTWSLFVPQQPLISLDRVLLIFTLVIMLGAFVEYLAIKRFDKVF